MKKILSLLLSIAFLLLFAFPAFSVQEPSESDSEITNPSSGVLSGLSPVWCIINTIDITFFVANSGIAYVTFLVTTNSNSGVTVKTSLEKKVFGSIWKKVSLDAGGNEWTDTTAQQYLEGTHSVKLSESGTYRAVVTVSAQGEREQKTVSRTYDANLLMGDADGNGKLTAADARLALRFSAVIQKYSAKQKTLCDINGDGLLTASDARLILRMSANLI